MKKIFGLILSAALLLGLVACVNTDNTSGSAETTTQAATATQANTEQEQTDDNQTPPQTDDKKALVVYFSWSGNTRTVAREIQSQTGADLFEITPATAYTTDYNTLLDVAQTEKRNNARPAIADSIDNIGQYDTVFVGYPNWWSDMPMIVYTFFDTYDLSGKTVIPFVTSGGSGFSNTRSAIRDLEPDAQVSDGLALSDSAARNPGTAVKNWLDGMGL